jgi:hypothetical protein
MLKQPMIEKLAAMRLLGMAEALKVQEQDPSARELSFLERFGLLVDQQLNWRENHALSRRLKNAKLRTPNACVEEIDYRTTRGLDKSVIRSLTQQSSWVGAREHLRAWTNRSCDILPLLTTLLKIQYQPCSVFDSRTNLY